MVSAARKTHFSENFSEISVVKTHSRLFFRFFPRPSPTLVDSQTLGAPSGPNLGPVRGDALFCRFSLSVLWVCLLGNRDFPGYRPLKSTPGLFFDFFRVREALRSTQEHGRTTLEAPTDPFTVRLFSVPSPAPDQNPPEYADPGSSKISRNMQNPRESRLSPLRNAVKPKPTNFG